ncbi:MAG: ribonuclease HII [Bacillaceae bacterium]|nr:ribonuclease HII [Bacillaceae bacterium]
MDLHKMTIQEVENWLKDQSEELTEDLLEQLEQDSRAGIRRLAEKVKKQQERQQKLRDQWDRMTRLEQNLYSQNYQRIAGVDEVGRGPIAGPVVAAAVILPRDFYLPGLNDSKQVPPSLRDAYYVEIMDKAVAVATGVSSVAVIDEINIYQASLRAMKEAVLALDPQPEITLNDAVTIPDLQLDQVPVIGGDGKSVSIAAASIVAKVTRDRMMAEYAKQYPEYGFDQNVGYGTPNHYEALKKYGPTPIHRRSFKPVSDMI